MNLRRRMIAVWLGASIGACGGRVDEIDGSKRDEPGGSGAASGAGGTGNGGRAPSGGWPASGAGSVSSAGSAGPGASGTGGRGEGGARNDGGQGSDAGASGGSPGSGGGGGARTGGAEGPASEVWVGQSLRTITFPEVAEWGRESIAGPQHVVLVLGTSAGGVVTASILFGDHEPPPRATDPDAFYPPIADGGFELQALRYHPLNGFAYTLRDLHIQDGRLTAWFETSELWSDWCALQTRSYPLITTVELSENIPETCASEDAPRTKADQEPLRVQADLCQAMVPAVCACKDDVCQAYPKDITRTNLDIELRGTLYEGKLEHDRESNDEIPWLKLRRVE